MASRQETAEVFKGYPAEISWLRVSDINRETLSADKVLSATDANWQSIDPGGAARNVDLPAEEAGLIFMIGNRADAAEAITVRADSAGATLATLSQDDVGMFVSDGTGWMAFKVAGAVT